MQYDVTPLSPDRWLADLFTSQAVQKGAVFRRKAQDVERYCGMDRFLAEIHRRGYHVVENAGQLVVFCNQEPLRWLTPPCPLSYKESGSKSFKDFETGAD